MSYRIGGKKGGLEGVVGSVRGKGWRVEEATDHISKFKSAVPRCTYSSSESKASVRRPPPPQILVSGSLVHAPPPGQTHHFYHHHQGNKGGKQGVNRAIISQEPKGSNKTTFNTILCLARSLPTNAHRVTSLVIPNITF